jgi:hypothetical protein
MSKLVPLLAPSQVPMHIREEYPKFLEFINAYYEFMNEYQLNIESLKDADAVIDPLYEYLRNELAKRFPESLIDKNRFIRSIRELYKRKSSFDGIELLFRMFFNDSIIIREPSKRILRASDGKWFQRKFFHIELLTNLDFDDIENSKRIYVRNSYGVFQIPIESAIDASASQIRITINGLLFLKLDADDIVDVLDSENNILYSGKVVPSSNRLRIAAPGKNWSVSQVFLIPGSIRDTVVRVVRVDNEGRILEVEIYEHGFYHAPNVLVSASPFPNKPLSGDASFSRTLVNVDLTDPLNPIFEYENLLTLNDYVEEIREGVAGYSTAKTPNTYFLEDYVLEDYVTEPVISQASTQTRPQSGVLVDPNLTLEEWLASQAYFIYETGILNKERGYYFDDSGHISNDEIRLQDGFFFQLFSYLIETTVDIKEYRDTLELIHPAGLKYFGNLNRTSLITFDSTYDVYRTFSFDTQYALSIADTEDSVVKELIKPVSDSAGTEEEIVKTFDKYNEDEALVDDGNTATLDTNISYVDDYFAEDYTATDLILVIG